MVQFMSAATVQNLPQYLAEDRARKEQEENIAMAAQQAAQQAAIRQEGYAHDDSARREGYAREDSQLAKKESKEEALAARMRKLGNEFMAKGDYTPQGLKAFAEKNEMSMPEMKGMVDMVVAFKKISAKDKKALINIRPQGANYTVRTEDQAGLQSFDKPEAAGGAGGAGGADELSSKVADWQKYASQTLKSSLGYTDQTGWPDKASQRKYDTVLAETDLGMAGKPGTDVIKVLNKEINRYDAATSAADEVKKIPADSLLTSKNDAKKAVDNAKDAGAINAEIKAELKRKGWNDKAIETILRDADPDNPLGL